MVTKMVKENRGNGTFGVMGGGVEAPTTHIITGEKLLIKNSIIHYIPYDNDIVYISYHILYSIYIFIYM